jgi:quercetin dioxygenase-like cupin family protein
MNSEKPPAKSEIPVAQAVGLLELVSYQEGSVVSRVLISRDTGNITLFAFDEGQGLSEHTAPFDALVQVLEGEVEISIDRKPLRAKVGDLVLMPAHRPHALKAITSFKMLLTMIRSKGTA